MGCGMDDEVKYKGNASFVMESPQDQFSICAKDSNENKEWVRVISLEIELAKKRAGSNKWFIYAYSAL